MESSADTRFLLMDYLVFVVRDEPTIGAFTAELPNIPVTGVGDSIDDALKDLQEQLHEYTDAMGLDDAFSLIASGFPFTHEDLQDFLTREEFTYEEAAVVG